MDWITVFRSRSGICCVMALTFKRNDSRYDRKQSPIEIAYCRYKRGTRACCESPGTGAGGGNDARPGPLLIARAASLCSGNTLVDGGDCLSGFLRRLLRCNASESE